MSCEQKHLLPPKHAKEKLLLRLKSLQERRVITDRKLDALVKNLTPVPDAASTLTDCSAEEAALVDATLAVLAAEDVEAEEQAEYSAALLARLAAEEWEMTCALALFNCQNPPP